MFCGLDRVLRHNNKGGIYVKGINCDGEFKPIMNKINDSWDINMNYSAQYEHFSDIEWLNRTLQEMFRVNYFLLPYKNMPRAMIQHLSMRRTRHLNCFPAKEGIFNYYSPHMILSGR